MKITTTEANRQIFFQNQAKRKLRLPQFRPQKDGHNISIFRFFRTKIRLSINVFLPRPVIHYKPGLSGFRHSASLLHFAKLRSATASPPLHPGVAFSKLRPLEIAENKKKRLQRLPQPPQNQNRIISWLINRKKNRLCKQMPAKPHKIKITKKSEFIFRQLHSAQIHRPRRKYSRVLKAPDSCRFSCTRGFRQFRFRFPKF